MRRNKEENKDFIERIPKYSPLEIWVLYGTKGLFYAIFRRKKFREMVIESRKELVKLGVLKPDGPSNSNRDFLFGAIDKMHTVNNLKAIENSLEKMKEADGVQNSNKN